MHPYWLAVVPTEKDEYRRSERGTWAHELKWQRRALADDLAWHFNRLVALCALWWLLALVPGALAALQASASAVAFSLALALQRVRELTVLTFSAQALVGSF